MLIFNPFHHQPSPIPDFHLLDTPNPYVYKPGHQSAELRRAVKRPPQLPGEGLHYALQRTRIDKWSEHRRKDIDNESGDAN
jgi:hypothetical protein